MIATKPQILSKIYEREQALAALGPGLTEEVIETAIRRSEAERDLCTAHDPTCLPGIIAWGRCNRFLRDRLVLLKWEANDDRNYPTVINPKGTVAIAVATGDEGTGLAEKHPGTKFPKGIVTQSAVDGNVQFLFAEMAHQKSLDAKRATWLLLKRRVTNSVHVELSLPSQISSDGIIRGWNRRIIFPTITLETDIPVQDDTGDTIDIPVIRRNSN